MPDYGCPTAALFLALCATVACDAEPPPEEVEARAAPMMFHGWGCRSCGFTNSPFIGSDLMDIFTVGGAQEPDVAELVAIEDPYGLRYDVEVDGSTLRAMKGAGIQGYALIGWSLVFALNGNEVPVEIANYASVEDWTVHAGKFDTYALMYQTTFDGGDVPTSNICPGLPLDYTTVAFTAGEVYDEEAYEVRDGLDQFVSLACVGTNTAKLKLMGFDPNDSYGSSAAQRQAALKMLAADYCGIGQPFTLPGTPLGITDELYHLTPGWPTVPADIEARWDDSGALCLSRTRLENASPPVTLGTVKNYCPLPPPCEGAPSDNASYGSVVTSLLPP